MQLFLSSYRFGDYAEVLQDMLGDEISDVGVITNAKDYKTLTERTESVRELFGSFAELGIDAHEIDLRVFFDQPDMLERELAKYKFIWLSGGNTFVLARALQQSGGDAIIRELVQSGKVIYGGESAGACIATPMLTGVEFGDDPYIVPEGYEDVEVWQGLGLVPFSIIPHYESEWEGYERMEEVLAEAGLPYKILRDHQVYVVNGEQAELLQ